jgi:1,3-beta-galactosyl-N-acetylhexosamine phosphorylase
MKPTETLTGSFTMPTEKGMDDVAVRLAKKWGADAIRDSDGTQLSDELLKLGQTVYSTICLVRADQEYPRKNPEHLPRKFLMSDPAAAAGDKVQIDPMAGYFAQKYQLDTDSDPKTWWEVIDRTTGDTVDAGLWELDSRGRVTVRGCTAGHVYTVNFLVSQIWDSTSMFNHICNKWTTPPVISTDPYHPAAYRHLMAYFDRWLAEHPKTDVVRLTTLAYHFTLDSGEGGADRYRDWLGYTDTVSIRALEDFAREYGYRLRGEDFVDEGYYHSRERLPTQRYLDWMAFVQRFVWRFGKDLIDRVHKAGKKAAIFWGDHWIGVEPYHPGCRDMGVDIHIGGCESGCAARRNADAPGSHTRELRLGPYFFPVESFQPGGNPLKNALPMWAKVRRAILRRCPDRIGFGGYLSVASQFPTYIEHAADLCDQFRQILARSRKGPAETASVRVGVLSAWGPLRSWIEEGWAARRFADPRGTNVLESLAGLPVEVRFISFQEIADHGVPADLDVIVNSGAAGTSWSGHSWWGNPNVVAAIRRWVLAGGGFVGVGEPTAFERQGGFFQLADILGVQKETGLSVGAAARPFTVSNHFIKQRNLLAADVGTTPTNVYVCQGDTTVVAALGKHVQLSARKAGDGRAVYLAALPFNFDNARVLYCALLWASRRETELRRNACASTVVDCAYYPATGEWAVANNVGAPQTTTLFNRSSLATSITLDPFELKWVDASAWKQTD